MIMSDTSITRGASDRANEREREKTREHNEGYSDMDNTIVAAAIDDVDDDDDDSNDARSHLTKLIRHDDGPSLFV
jgi:hypothetical protein